MRVDAAVCREKFDLEVRRLTLHEATLRGWGCLIQRVEYPEIDAIFIPKAPLRIIHEVQQQKGLIVHPQALMMVEVRATDVPHLTARAFGVRLQLDDFDVRPASLTFRDPWSWEYARWEQIPRGILVTDTAQHNVVLESHPSTNRPFFCVPGTREYHEHPQHTGDDWALIRGDFGALDLLGVVWRTCVNHAMPTIAPQNSAVRCMWEWRR